MSRYRNVIFTLNNYTEQNKKDVQAFSIKYCRYLVYGEEIAPNENKTPHLQGYIEMKNQMTLSNLKKKINCNHIHIEKRKASAKQAANYCKGIHPKKQPNDVIYEYGEISNQGKRKNIQVLKERVLAGEKLKEIILSDDINNFQDIRIVEKFKQYCSKPRDSNDPPTVIWIWGETGTGKTRYVYDKHKDIYSTLSTYQWWDGYEQQEVILIDDMRKDFCKFHTLLKLLDRYPHKVQIKGGTVEINSKYIYITAPYSPELMYYTREDKGQLLRRITKVIELKHIIENA